ncbi:MAG: TRAP transporter small permease [Arachnia sp.]
MVKVISIACIVLFSVLVGTVVWQVFARQVLQSPSVWSEELARYLFVWLGFFGAALVFSERGHIAMDFLVRKLPTPLLRVTLILTQIALIAFIAIVFIWGGISYAQQSWNQSLSALPLTVGPMFLVLPLTGVLIIWFALIHLVEAIISTDPSTLLAVDTAAEPIETSENGPDEMPNNPPSTDTNQGV